MSCETLQYYLQRIETIISRSCNYKKSKGSVTLMFLSGNHSVAPCQRQYYCTSGLYFAYLSMVGFGGNNIIIHNLDIIVVHIDQWLSIENIMFYNGELMVRSVTQLSIENVIFYNEHLIMTSVQIYIDSAQLIECFLAIDKAELGEIVKLQAHNSLVSIIDSNNVTFTSCTFHDFDNIDMAYPIETAVSYYRRKP